MVNMNNQVNDYVKDIQDKSKLDASIQSVDWISSFDFTKFDKDIEDSFQKDFLNANKDNFLNLTTQQKQDLFNGWLNWQFNKIDAFKDKEIAKKIIVPTTFELQNLNTLSELAIFQQQLQIERDQTRATETLTLWDTEVSISFYNWITATQVTREINWINFKDKAEIIDLLKGNKVKELQQKIWWNKIWNKYENLPKHWDDWKFWTETFEALKKYITKNKIDWVATTAWWVWWAWWGTESVGGDVWWAAAESGRINAVGVWNVDAWWNSIETEVGLNEYGWQSHYEITVGDTITFNPIQNFPEGITWSTVPPDVVSNDTMKIDGWKLKYTPKDEWHENFTIVVMDNTNNIIYRRDVTVDVAPTPESPDVRNEYNDFIRTLNWTPEQKQNQISSKIVELKGKYLAKSLENNSEYLETEERRMDIQKLINLLGTEEQKIAITEHLKKVGSGSDRWSSEAALTNYINSDTCIINIWWEYINGEQFLNLLKRGRLGNGADLIRAISVEMNSDYLENPALEKNRNHYKITRLVLSDDSNFLSNTDLTKDQEIQYNARAYVNTEKWKDMRSDRQAIKNLLWIRGLFGRWWVNENLSIATEDYNTNNPNFRERRDLRQLKNILMSCLRESGEWQIDIRSAFEKVVEEYSRNPNVNWSSVDRNSVWNLDRNGIWRKSDKRQLAWLGELYTKYMAKQWWDYFQKAMWLLDNYFVKWIKTDDFNYNDFKDWTNWWLYESIYQQENIGRVEWLISPDKSRQAIKSVFRDRGDFNLWVNFENSPELKELEKITKKVDLVDLFDRISMARWDRPILENKHEEKFYSQYEKYKESITEDKKDSNGNYIVLDQEKGGHEYYNAVFHFLVWIGEGRQDIVSAVNSMKLTDKLDIEYNSSENSLDEVWYWSEEEKQFVLRLCDLNKDGRVDFGDRGVRMWLEIQNIYKSVKTDIHHGVLWDDINIWEKLREFALDHMNKNWNTNLSATLDDSSDLNDVLEQFNRNPGLLNYLQGMLVNSPIPIEYIFKYGKSAAENYLMPQIMSNNVDVAWLNDLFKREYDKLLSQWLKDTPELRTVLKPMVYGALMENDGIIYGAGGVWLSLNTEKAGTFSLNLGYGTVPGIWENWGPWEMVWVMMSWWDSYNVSENTAINVWVSGWSSAKSVFVPIASIGVGITSMINENQLDENLRPKSAKYVTFGGNVSMVGVLPTWWLSAGISQDRMAGIDRQYENIIDTLSGNDGILYDILTNVDLSGADVFASIQGRIEQKFDNASPDETRQAAQNIYRWLSYYGLNEWWVLSHWDPRLERIIQDITKNYALQRKNEAIRWANGVHIESVWVWVQFLAGFVPVPMLTTSLAWYKNLYSTETEESIANYYAKLSTGKWMEYTDWKEFYDTNDNITRNAVNYLNAKLSIAHPNIDSPDLDILISKSRAENSTWHTDGSTNSLYIPKNLYRYANINISADISNFVKTVTGDGTIGVSWVEYIEVPLNTKIALMDYSRTNTSRFNLIIWDTKAKMDDIQIRHGMDRLNWRPDLYEWIPDDVSMSLESIVEKVTTLKDSISENERWNFPIESCSSLEYGMATFDLKTWLSSKCEVVGGTHSRLKIQGDKLIMPEFGSLTIYQTKSGEYKLYYNSRPNNAMNINYQIESDQKTLHNGTSVIRLDSDGQIISNETRNVEWDVITRNIQFTDIFDKYDSIDRIFDGIEKDLSRMDDNAPWKYATFMNAASDIVNRSMIDNSNYDRAFDALKEILKNKIDGNIFDSLRNKINTSNLSTNDKVMMVDRFKSIFSYHIDLTNWNNDWVYLKSLIRWRWDRYRNLKWYDRSQNFPALQNDYRASILNQIWNKDNLDKVEKNNLFGMTAFYRLWNSNEWRSYSMTQMWSTNVLGEYMEKIAPPDLEATQHWFLNNLDKSGPHKDILKETLKEKIWLNTEITDENLKKLLKWEEVDISGKKVTIDLDYVFYLLWECANESIWINLKWITIKTTPWTDPDPEITHDIDGNRRSVSVDWNISRNRWLYTNTVESTNREAYARKNSAWVGAMFARIPWEPRDHPGSMPGEWGPWSQPSPWDGTGSSVWENRDWNPPGWSWWVDWW